VKAVRFKWFNLRNGFRLSVAVILFAGLSFRSAGLFLGLNHDMVFHPDTPKQMGVLGRYLNDRHVEIQDNLFHDGYPFGLNRLDEFIIETWYIVARPVYEWVHSGNMTLEYPTGMELFYISRVLRVAYSMIAMILVGWSVWRISKDRIAVLASLLLLALSPLAAVVTHSASGDVGVDLFAAVVLFGMALHAGNRRMAPVMLAGLAAGIAFACKYQGALLVWMIALPVGFGAWKKPKGLQEFVVKGFSALFAFLLGAFLFTPGFWVNPNRTWKDMRANFEFIKNYGIPAEFMEKSLWGKLEHGLLHNIPLVLTTFGILMVVLLMVSLIRVVLKLRKGPSNATAKEFLWVSVASFPLFVLALSVSLKPAFQPFHFSFLLVPIAFSTGCLFWNVKRSGQRWAYTGLILLLCAVSVFDFQRSRRELFFWQGNDTFTIATFVSRQTFVTPLEVKDRDANLRHILRAYDTEPSTLPVFRNSPGFIMALDAKWWREMGRLPLPTVPLPQGFDWVFLDGPVFLRNDRQYHLNANHPYRFRIKGPLEGLKRLTIGFRSGAYPVTFSGNLGGEPFSLNLPPHHQEVKIFRDVEHWVQDGRDGVGLLSQLDIITGPGDGWITFLPTQKEQDLFQFFGPSPDPADALPEWGGGGPELEGKTEKLRFYESEEAVALGAEPTPLTDQTLVLPRGQYELSARVDNTSDQDLSVAFQFVDPSGVSGETLEHKQTVPPGRHKVSWILGKSFVPYEVSFEAFTSELPAGSEMIVEQWSIRPQYAVSPPLYQAEVLPENDVRFRIEVEDLMLLTGFAVERDGQNVTYTVKGEWTIQDANRFEESVIFLHLRNEKGDLLKGLDFWVREASFSEDRINLHTNTLPALPEGSKVDVYIGVYQPRSREKLKLRVLTPPPQGVKELDQSYHIYTFEL